MYLTLLHIYINTFKQQIEHTIKLKLDFNIIVPDSNQVPKILQYSTKNETRMAMHSSTRNTWFCHIPFFSHFRTAGTGSGCLSNIHRSPILTGRSVTTWHLSLLFYYFWVFWFYNFFGFRLCFMTKDVFLLCSTVVGYYCMIITVPYRTIVAQYDPKGYVWKLRQTT